MACCRVELSSQWNVLGPFPIHAREQHYISPSYPLNLLEPINWSKSWPSSYADGGFVSWTTANSDPSGNLTVSFPSIRWASLRATEGWAALQHHAVLKTRLTIYPPSEALPGDPLSSILIHLKQASFFTILPCFEDKPHSMFTPVWYQGDIYNSENAAPQTVRLPVPPSLDVPTTYDIFVSGDYEIRLFGDPRNTGSDVPVQMLNLTVGLEEPDETVIHEAKQDVICDFVQGITFGTTVGVGLRSVSGWWIVRSVTLLQPTSNSRTFKVALLNEVRLAPSQTRIVPIVVTQLAPVDLHELRLSVNITSASHSRSITIILPIRQLESWNAQCYQPIRGTYLYAASMPTHFIAIPPQYPNENQYRPPIVALHGAGVDIILEKFWSEAVPRQQHSWIVMPTGRTPWGLDWHGPSAQDAWSAVDALASILAMNISWRSWGYAAHKSVVLVGHSNGGQGAWYLASRFPDRVLGVVPAAAYIKSQAYVPLTMSRSAHYIDPALRAVLESALTPDDNDIHLSNLVGTPVCAVHGGDDENVPVWHTREAIGILTTWSAESDVLYQEAKGQGHWYSSVFRNGTVRSFLNKILLEPSQNVTPKIFTISVASPAEQGSVYGWRVKQLIIPGRLGRMQICTTDTGTVTVTSSNIHLFSIDRRQCSMRTVLIDGTDITLSDSHANILEIYFERAQGKWKVLPRTNLSHIQPSGRLQLILTSTTPLTIIIPTKDDSYKLSLAQRLAHALHLFHRLDVDIIDENEALSRLDHEAFTSGNAIVMGGTNMRLIRHTLSLRRTPFTIENSHFIFNGHEIGLEKSESAALFLHPPFKGSQGSVLFMVSSSVTGFENAIRLFPIRTGVPIPDWLVIGRNVDQLGAAGIQGAGFWGRQWSWNQVASWSAYGFD
ncbi:hypothetical protein APHAL10511_001335 [Amanita phalloides]|nr:hypothetical protein APHAL10511_001335 [Amanita phalloides]